MKYIYTIDADGFYIPTLLKLEYLDYVCSQNEIDESIPEGLYKAKWDGIKWIEGGDSSFIRLVEDD